MMLFVVLPDILTWCTFFCSMATLSGKSLTMCCLPNAWERRKQRVAPTVVRTQARRRPYHVPNKAPAKMFCEKKKKVVRSKVNVVHNAFANMCMQSVKLTSIGFDVICKHYEIHKTLKLWTVLPFVLGVKLTHAFFVHIYSTCIDKINIFSDFSHTEVQINTTKYK